MENAYFLRCDLISDAIMCRHNNKDLLFSLQKKKQKSVRSLRDIRTISCLHYVGNSKKNYI